MSRLSRHISVARHCTEEVTRKPKRLCNSAILAHLHAMGDPTGEFHPELLGVNEEPKMITVNPELERWETDYLSELAISHSMSEKRG